MVHFIRTKTNRTIISCSASATDLSSVVDVMNYSIQLLSIYNDPLLTLLKKEEFINDISALSEIRGWWWEGEKEFGNWTNINAFVKEKFMEVSNKWGLIYVTD